MAFGGKSMGKILAGLLLIVMTFSAVGCGEMEEDHRAQAKYRRITADEAQVMMAKTENYLILDVRTPEDISLMRSIFPWIKLVKIHRASCLIATR